MANGDFDWAIPVMRAGYAGRALVYLSVAGVSAWSLVRGGEAEGTSSTLKILETTPGGTAVLLLIAVGLIAYAVWRLIDAAWDLECYGSDGEGLLARAGMVVTGIIHGVLGIGAIVILVTAGDGGGSSGAAKAASMVLSLPGGRWILGGVGLITIGAGLYYGRKGLKRDYRQTLSANPVTRNMDGALAFGVVSQGFVICVIGIFLGYAAWTYAPDQAGGTEKAFEWLSDQPFGDVLVGALCVGLLAFALFCAVNARYRIVERASDPDEIKTLSARIEAEARKAAG